MAFSNIRAGSIILAEPYRFVPPYRGTFWTTALWPLYPGTLSRRFGVIETKVHGAQHVRRSIARGQGILLGANHSRHSDPFVFGWLNKEIGQPVHVMATWHLFKQGRILAALLRRIGGFSVYREGPDRMAFKTAIKILVEARRPLVIFPEGLCSHANDFLRPFMDGTAAIARGAARRRAAGVALHPVVIRYSFCGNAEAVVAPVIAELEVRVGLAPGSKLSLVERIFKVGAEVVARSEEKYLGARQAGDNSERRTRLVEHILRPLETEWLWRAYEGEAFTRMKQLRARILPGLITKKLSESETARRWKQLDEIDDAERLYRQPPNHLRTCDTPEQLIETVERIEEALTGRAQVFRPWRVVIEVGEAIEVNGVAWNGTSSDPLMIQLRSRMEALLQPEVK
ncbi:MAG: 1-acyl-sn-glycerol-3-phosphate acyltransferase [Pedosphaera sp.]|nr:1-acyl-sn-glycerol-3-phosphate acyltransferase [Pedosphaera sp.]